jgi:hypothetical protein
MILKNTKQLMRRITTYTTVANMKENNKIKPMKKPLMIILAILTTLGFGYAQTTATDFTTNDCNGISHNLFDELDNGNVIVIAWVMPCPPCATYTIPAYSAVQSFATSNPGQVSFYLVDDFANTNCATLTNWGNSNNMPLNTTFSSSDISMSDYGTNGMPKVVVLGGTNHTIFLNKNDDKINFPGVQGAITDALNAPLGVEQIKESHFQLSTYPNPVNNTLNVSSAKTNTGSVVYSILDVSGKVVIQENDLTSTIDVSTLNNGNYFLKVSSEKTTESIPFVVSH